jgi:hypothetical protein
LKEESFLKEKEFLSIISRMETSLQEAGLQKSILNFIEKHSKSSESDDEIINYANWLREKNKRKRSI